MGVGSAYARRTRATPIAARGRAGIWYLKHGSGDRKIDGCAAAQPVGWLPTLPLRLHLVRSVPSCPIGGYVMWVLDLWHWIVPGVLIGLGSLCAAGLTVILWAHREMAGEYARIDVLGPTLERYLPARYVTRQEWDKLMDVLFPESKDEHDRSA